LPGPLIPYRCGFVCWHELGETPPPATSAPVQPRDGAAVNA